MASVDWIKWLMLWLFIQNSHSYLFVLWKTFEASQVSGFFKTFVRKQGVITFSTYLKIVKVWYSVSDKMAVWLNSPVK